MLCTKGAAASGVFDGWATKRSEVMRSLFLKRWALGVALAAATAAGCGGAGRYERPARDGTRQRRTTYPRRVERSTTSCRKRVYFGRSRKVSQLKS